MVALQWELGLGESYVRRPEPRAPWLLGTFGSEGPPVADRRAKRGHVTTYGYEVAARPYVEAVHCSGR
jgi:hypothetical protein